MIIAAKSAPSEKPGMVRMTFNCAADEATPLFMAIDIVYIYMQKGEKRELEIPAANAPEVGSLVELHEIAPELTLQHKDFNMAWEQEDLPNRAALRPNPELPDFKL